MVTKDDLKFLADKYLKDQTLLFLKKNKDYGDSFTKSISKFGAVSAYVRMDDKVNRFLQLKDSNTIEVADEKIEDTLLDLFNYVVMYEAYQKNKLVTLVDYLDCLHRAVINLYLGSKSESYLYKVLTTCLKYEEDVAECVFYAVREVVRAKIK